MSTTLIIAFIALSLFVIVVLILHFNKRKKKKKESELGIFHHPSNFKKPPIEWVQKPKDSATDKNTKKL